MAKKEVKIPIIKNGRDICRLIFTKFDNNLFDVKIDSLRKSFTVQTYSLFASRPKEIMTGGNLLSSEHDISYHHGTNNKPVVIHIKNKAAKEDEQKYFDLPVNNILPPSNKNDFPLPLMKIEIPDEAVKSSKEYKKKKYHHVVDISNSNVVEIHMANSGFSINQDRFSGAWQVYFGLSFEYFCTNTILSGSQKMNTYLPDKPEIRSIIINDLNGVSFIINIYPEPRLNSYRKELQYTFIENKYAEEILLNTILVFPARDDDGGFSGFYMGGCTLDDLSVLTRRVNPDNANSKFGLIRTEKNGNRRRYTVAQALIQLDRIPMIEWGNIIPRANDSAEKMYGLLAENLTRRKREKCELQDKCLKFTERLRKARNIQNKEIDDDVYCWLRTDPAYVEETTYAMLSLYLGLDHYLLGECLINEQFKHFWLLYDENWDISICGSVLNRCLDQDDDARFTDVHLSVGLDPMFTVPSPREDISRIRSKCHVRPMGYKRVSFQEREYMFAQNNGLIRRVYENVMLLNISTEE